jgi:hypothetical protein
MSGRPPSLQQASADERLRDALRYANKLRERGNNVLTLHRLRLAERYLKGDLHLHVHLDALPKPDREAEQFCAVFYGVRGVENINGIRDGLAASGRRRDESSAHPNEDGNQQVVLVRVVHDAKLPEQIIPARLPRFVWFERLENVHNGLSRALMFSAKSGFEFLGGAKDGKVVLPVLGQHGDGPDCSPENVQRRAEVMHCVASERSPSERREFAHVHADDNLPRLMVSLCDNDIRVTFAEGGNFGYQITDVLFGPFDLDPTAGRPIGHEGRDD